MLGHYSLLGISASNLFLWDEYKSSYSKAIITPKEEEPPKPISQKIIDKEDEIFSNLVTIPLTEPKAELEKPIEQPKLEQIAPGKPEEK